MAVAVAAESAAPSRQRIEGRVESQSVRSDSVPAQPVDSASAVRRRGGRINKGAGVESGDSAVLAAMRGGEADSSGTAGRQRLTRLNREKVDLEDMVSFSAKDSLVLVGKNSAFMYGDSEVKYGDMELQGAEIKMDDGGPTASCIFFSRCF